MNEVNLGLVIKGDMENLNDILRELGSREDTRLIFHRISLRRLLIFEEI